MGSVMCIPIWCDHVATPWLNSHLLVASLWAGVNFPCFWYVLFGVLFHESICGFLLMMSGPLVQWSLIGVGIGLVLRHIDRRQRRVRLPDNKFWITNTGDDVIQKAGLVGKEGLSDKERLVYCLWFVDQRIRQTGHFDSTCDTFLACREDGVHLAQHLRMPKAAHLFSLPPKKLEEKYFSLFDAVCDEVKQTNAVPTA